MNKRSNLVINKKQNLKELNNNLRNNIKQKIKITYLYS